MSGQATRALGHAEPLMVAWNAYKATDDFANTKKWATDLKSIVCNPGNADGVLWAAFMAGWNAATERAAMLHENINPASDQERHNGDPGAGAMGAVIEYRDAIRRDLDPSAA